MTDREWDIFAPPSHNQSRVKIAITNFIKNRFGYVGEQIWKVDEGITNMQAKQSTCAGG